MKYLKIIVIFLVLCFGFVIGIVYKDIPYLRLNPEIKLYEPFMLMLTALIGLLLPFFIKRWIEDSRQIKNNLIDELKCFLREVEIIRDKVKYCYFKKNIIQSDKEEINILFEQADLKYDCLKQQLIAAYDKETKLIREEINSKYFDYWKLTTGAEFMSTKFKMVGDDFYRRHNKDFISFETVVKKAIIRIHQL